MSLPPRCPIIVNQHQCTRIEGHRNDCRFGLSGPEYTELLHVKDLYFKSFITPTAPPTVVDMKSYTKPEPKAQSRYEEVDEWDCLPDA